MTAPFWAGSGPPEGLPIDQRPDEAESLCWTSAPLTEDLAMLGRPVADLWLSASQPVAQVAVKIGDVAPDGTSALLARGVLNLTRRHGLSTAEPMVPGRIERVEVPLQVCGAIVPAGHRLRVAIAGADWPLAWPPPRPSTLTLHHDAAHPSSIRLPVQRGLTTVGPDLGMPEPAARAERGAAGGQHRLAHGALGTAWSRLRRRPARRTPPASPASPTEPGSCRSTRRTPGGCSIAA